MDEAVSLMRLFHGHVKALSVERQVRTLALEEGDPVAPQVNRVHEKRSGSLDVGELNENIEKLTILLANNTYGWTRAPAGPCEVFFLCGNWAHCPLFCSNVQRRYPRPRDGVYVQAAQEKALWAACKQPVAVKLDKESGCIKDDVMEMREVMVRTGSDRCTLVTDMTINNHPDSKPLAVHWWPTVGSTSGPPEAPTSGPPEAPTSGPPAICPLVTHVKEYLATFFKVYNNKNRIWPRSGKI